MRRRVARRRAMEEAADVEHTLSILPTAHVYKLPPRPSAGGWQCQQWPKENHIFSGKVIIVAQGSKCTIRLVDSESGSLFAQCPLDNDNPTLSVEPVIDSSRYFVVRVADGSGRYAFLGMGFVERSDAFEFNVTIADHVKRLRNEKEAQAIAAAPAPPPQDFTLKGSVSISLPGGATSKPRAPPAAAGAGAGLMALAPPPPGGGGSSQRGRRPVASAAASGTTNTAAATFSDPFSASSATTNTAAAASFSDSFSPSDTQSSGAAAADAFASFGGGGSDPFGAATDPFGSATPFAAAPEGGFSASAAFGTEGGASAEGASTEGGAAPQTFAPASFEAAAATSGDAGGDGGWVAFG